MAAATPDSAVTSVNGWAVFGAAPSPEAPVESSVEKQSSARIADATMTRNAGFGRQDAPMTARRHITLHRPCRLKSAFLFRGPLNGFIGVHSMSVRKRFSSECHKLATRRKQAEYRPR